MHVARRTVGEFLLCATPVLSHLHQQPDPGLGHIPFLPEIPGARPADDSRLSGPGHCADCALPPDQMLERTGQEGEWFLMQAWPGS